MEALKKESLKNLEDSCKGFSLTNVSKNLSNYLFSSIPQDTYEEKIKMKKACNYLFMDTTSNHYFNVMFQDIYLNHDEKTLLKQILNNFYDKGLVKLGYESKQEFIDAYLMIKLTIKKLTN